MPIAKLPIPQVGMDVEELTALVYKYYRELEYVLGHLDDDNVSSISTDKLVAGNALISTALIDDLQVGTNVTMGPNATINWDNITNIPTEYLTQNQLNAALADYVTNGTMTSALANTLTNSNFSTIITKDYIASMNLIVGQEILMGANATISWVNVTGTENIPLRSDLTWTNIADKPTNLLTQTQLTTALTDYVTTGNMTTALANTLNTGNFNTVITKDYIASMNLMVGNEILMGANASISWLKVSDRPTIPSTAAEVGAIPATYIDAYNVFTGRVYGENIRGSVITTANFNGSGNYIQLQREFMTFWDSANNLMKLSLGFVPYATGVNIPGIVFGAGDTNGYNRGYISKDTDSFDIYYIDGSAKVSAVSLKGGKIYLNDTEIPAFSPSSPLPLGYLESGAKWSQTLAKITSTGNIDWTLMPPPTAAQIGALPNTTTVLTANDIRSTVITKSWIGTLGLLVGTEIQMGSNAKIEWINVSNQPSIPNGAKIDSTGNYTGTVSWMNQVTSKPTILTSTDVTSITATYVATPNLYTNIGTVNNTLNLGSTSSNGYLIFRSGASVFAYDDWIGVGLMLSANTVCFDYATHVDFKRCSDVDFTGVNVLGLSAASATAKFA